MKLPSSLDTDPLPAPIVLVVLTVRVKSGENVTVTGSALVVTLTSHEPLAVPMPVTLETAPVHPANTEPPPAVAFKVTVVPELKGALHVPVLLVQALMLPSTLVTDPDPTTVTVTGNVARSKFAATVVVPLMVTMQVPVPEQPPPLQLVNTEAAELGDAVRVTTVP